MTSGRYSYRPLVFCGSKACYCRGQMPGRFNRLAVVIGCAALALACNDTPADLRVWRVTDHDHTENPNADQVQVTDAGSGEPGHGLDDVTIVAWQQNCTSCHGPLGRGDGPQGQLVHASDLSRPDWQATVTDDAIASTIRQGPRAHASLQPTRRDGRALGRVDSHARSQSHATSDGCSGRCQGRR